MNQESQPLKLSRVKTEPAADRGVHTAGNTVKPLFLNGGPRGMGSGQLLPKLPWKRPSVQPLVAGIEPD